MTVSTPSDTICPVCQGARTAFHAVAQDVEYFTFEHGFSIMRCTDCDVLFVDPMLHDRLGEIYPSNYYSFKPTTRGFVQRVKEALDRRTFAGLVRDIEGKTLSALDIGGGTGWLLEQVKASDPRVTKTTVVDIDANAHSAAFAAGHEFFLGRIEEFETTEKFDLVLMLNLIEHVSDPGAILRQVRKLLAPGGRVLIKTPNFDALDARIFRHRSWGGYHTPRHFVLFNKASLHRLAENAGFEVAAFDYTQGAPFWTVSVLNELRRLGLVRISAERPSIYHPLAPFLMAAFAAFDLVRKPFSPPSQMFVILTAA